MTLGIIGGCGPAAGAYFYTRLIEMTDAREDGEHIDVLLAGRASTPDRTAALLYGGQSPLPAIAESARALEGGGADLLVLLCHTAHAYLPALRSLVHIPFLDLVNLTAKAAAARGVRRLGVLCSAGTRHAHLYDRACAAQGIRAVYPDAASRAALQEEIYRALKGGRAEGGAALRNAASSAVFHGADGIALACTELSLPAACAPTHLSVWQAGQVANLPVLDPIDLLLRHIIPLFGRKIKAEEEMSQYASWYPAGGAVRRPLAAR